MEQSRASVLRQLLLHWGIVYSEVHMGPIVVCIGEYMYITVECKNWWIFNKGKINGAKDVKKVCFWHDGLNLLKKGLQGDKSVLNVFIVH